MRHIILLALLLTITINIGCAYESHRQPITLGTGAPDASAIMDMKSTTQGALPPRMTTVQRDAIVAPAEGLLIFNTTTNSLEIFSSATWGATGGGGSDHPLWLTSTIYGIGAIVVDALTFKVYRANALHTSDATLFATDLALALWDELSDDLDRLGVSVDNTLPRFDGTTGGLIQSSSVTISDTDVIGNITGVAVGAAAPAASSILDTISTTQGTRPCPTMTEAQRDAIAAPASGLCVYNSDTDKLNVYNTTTSAWEAAGGGLNKWLTATAYIIDDVVWEPGSDKIYRASTGHTSGVFATDIANWTELTDDLSRLGVAVDDTITTWDGTTGDLVQSSSATIVGNDLNVVGDVGGATATITATAVIEDLQVTTSQIIGDLFANLAGSAVFEVKDSTNALGSIPWPLVTEAQRDAITTPADSLMVYNTDTNEINVYDGTAWRQLGGTATTSTLQDVYNNSAPALIVADGTNNGLIVRDNGTPIGVDLLDVQDNASASVFSVDVDEAFAKALRFLTTLTTPVLEAGKMFYHQTAKALSFYDDEKLIVLKDDAQKKNLMSNAAGDAEYQTTAILTSLHTASGGTLVIDNGAANQLEGTNVFKWTPSVVNQTLDFPTITVPQVVNTDSINLGYSFRYKYDGDDGDVEVRAECVDDSSVLLGVSDDDVTLYSNIYKANGIISVPKDCNEVKLGVEVVTYNAGKILYYDNIKISSNPFVYKNLTRTERAHYSNATAYGSAATRVPVYINTNFDTTGKVVQITNTAANGFKILALKDCTLGVTVVTVFNTAGQEGGFSFNSASLTTGFNSLTEVEKMGAHTNHGVAGVQGNSLVIELKAGDFIHPHFGGTAFNTQAARNHIVLTATAEAEHVVHAEEKREEWIDYTPTTQGFGTIAAVEFKYRRVGDSIEIHGVFTAGTVTAVEAQVGLPSGMTIDSSKVSAVRIVGRWAVANTTSDNFNVTATGGDTYLNITQQQAGGFETPKNGNSCVGTGNKGSIYATVPILGWTGSNQYFVAVPVTDNENVFSVVMDNNGTCTVTSKNVDWLDPTTPCNRTATGISTVNFKAGFFTVTPAITVTADDAGVMGSYTGETTTSVVARTTAHSGTAIDVPFSIIVQRQGADYKPNNGLVSGKFSKVRVAYVKDEKAAGTHGGTATSGSWELRDLNTVSGDTDIVSLASNIFTLQPGKYIINADAPARDCDGHKIKLVGDPSGTPFDAIIGTMAKAHSTDLTGTTSTLKGVIDITVATDYQIEHRVESTATNGHGEATNFSVVEVYTQVEIIQILAR